MAAKHKTRAGRVHVKAHTRHAPVTRRMRARRAVATIGGPPKRRATKRKRRR